jgi:hypothetical protein
VIINELEKVAPCGECIKIIIKSLGKLVELYTIFMKSKVGRTRGAGKCTQDCGLILFDPKLCLTLASDRIRNQLAPPGLN